MSKLASIILNWIGGGKTPIPIRFLKSVDVPGNAPNSGNNIHILEVPSQDGSYSINEGLAKLKLDGQTPTLEQLNNLKIEEFIIKTSFTNSFIQVIPTSIETNNNMNALSLCIAGGTYNTGADYGMAVAIRIISSEIQIQWYSI